MKFADILSSREQIFSNTLSSPTLHVLSQKTLTKDKEKWKKKKKIVTLIKAA